RCVHVLYAKRAQRFQRFSTISITGGPQPLVARSIVNGWIHIPTIHRIWTLAAYAAVIICFNLAFVLLLSKNVSNSHPSANSGYLLSDYGSLMGRPGY
ncbi:MAG: hypothetical protein ACLUD0_11650, partial [Eubacterium ramulus]